MTDFLIELLDRIGQDNLQRLILSNRPLLAYMKTQPWFKSKETQCKAFKLLIKFDEITYDSVLKYLKDNKPEYYHIISNQIWGYSWLRFQVLEIKEHMRRL